MAKQLFALLIITAAALLQLAISSKYQACNIHKLECPRNSICSQRDHDDNGECMCPRGFEFNPHATGPSDYCNVNENSIGDASAVSSSSTSEKTVVHIQPPPESHHVVIGILVPMLLVVLVIGAAYGLKKFHPVRRLREYVISRRRNRPLYEDVMMTQELDDPPLM